jgi:hypothetical protein
MVIRGMVIRGMVIRGNVVRGNDVRGTNIDPKFLGEPKYKHFRGTNARGNYSGIFRGKFLGETK